MTRRIIYGVIAGCLVFAVWFALRHRDSGIDAGISSTVLPPQDAEKLIINQHSHTITIVKRGKDANTETKQYLSPVASIEVRKDGAVEVTSRRWGTENSLSLGVLYGSDLKLRGVASLGLLYYERWEFGVGLGVASSVGGTTGIVDVTYNAVDNIVVGVYIDNKKNAGVLVGLKF